MKINANPFPQWTTEITGKNVFGEDQLGIEGAAQGYQQDILPGIITVTDHARYYSFYAWIVYRFIFGKNSSRLLQDFRGPFFRRHEMAMILSAYRHHSNGKLFSGVVGSGTNNMKVKKFWGTDEMVSLDQDYFQNKEGGFGQYYQTAMKVMGIIDDPENPRWVYRLTDRGKELAEAYQSSISGTQYSHHLETHGQVTQINRTEAEEFGQVGCICSEALQFGADRPLLLDTFFRLSEPQSNENLHVRRRNSLGVALDLVGQAEGQFRREMLRPALYLGEYKAGLRYQPTLELTEWAKRWQMVEVRHLFTFGIQCLWAAFLLELGSQMVLSRSTWQEWITTQLNVNGWNMPVCQLGEKLCHMAGLTGNFDELLQITNNQFGLASGLDEYSLYLKATHNQTNNSLLFQTGVAVLLQLFLRFSPNFIRQDPIWQEMAYRERLPLNPYFHQMQVNLQNKEWQTVDWIHWIYQDYIFEQHEFIALEKLRYQEYDTFKFYYEDGTFHWPKGKEPYQEPIRLAANRLNNCFSMLIDLGLILENEDGTLGLSPDGVDYHKKVVRGLQDEH